METRKAVRPIQVNYECECGGKFLPTGICFTVNPPLYQHKCTDCDRMENISNKTYPYIEYVSYEESK